MGNRATGINAVENIEIASVTQNMNISIETATALMALGFISSGTGRSKSITKTIKPNAIPVFCRMDTLIISLLYSKNHLLYA